MGKAKFLKGSIFFLREQWNGSPELTSSWENTSWIVNAQSNSSINQAFKHTQRSAVSVTLAFKP